MMSKEPSITKQLNSIIDFLHYQGHISLKLASDRDSDEINKENPLLKLKTS